MNSNPIHRNGRAGSSVRHSKENALSEREFELLLQGARELGATAYYREPDPAFTVYALGRLGLRRGELAHLRESWIDWREKMICIPTSEPCTKSKDGEEPCGYCHQLARQRVDHADDLTLDEALEWMWVPKTEAGARGVYYGYDARAELFIERYFASEEIDAYAAGSNSVHRRVKRSAELAPELDPENVSPHSLRATACTWHVSRGLKLLSLMQYMGWKDPSTAKVYISSSGENTARRLNAIHSR